MDADFVINLVALGAPNVGKSQLIKRYLTQQFTEEYQPTGLEQLTMSIRVGTATAKMQIWDFGGRIGLDTDIGRKLIERGDIFLLCFNVGDPSSLETVRQILTVISPYRANAFVGLIGCKADLRADLAPNPVTESPTEEETNKKNPNEDTTTEKPSTEEGKGEGEPEHASTPRPTEEPEQPSASTVPLVGVPREQAYELATQAEVSYFEVSAKTNMEVQTVFHTALIYAYKKHISKKKSPQEEEQEQRERAQDEIELKSILKAENPVFLAEFFNREKIRNIFVFLFKSRDEDTINYLAHPSILVPFLETALLDLSMPTPENRSFREFSVTALDNFFKLDPIFANAVANASLLDSLFALFFNVPKFSETPIPRKRYLIRFICHLIDNYTQQFIEYAHNTKIIRKLTEIIENDDAKEIFGVLLSSEKKYVERSGPPVNFTLVEDSGIAQFLCEQLGNNRISLVDSFFRVLTSVRGFSSQVLVDIVKFGDFQICQNSLKTLVNDPSNAFDTVLFFNEAILRVIAINASLQKDFEKVIRESINPIYGIISATATAFSPKQNLAEEIPATATTTTTTTTTTHTQISSSESSPATTVQTPPTKLHIHAILLLIDGILRRSLIGISSESEIPGLLKPLVLDCLSIFFNVKYGNVLHFTIAGIIVACFERQYTELIQILLQEGKLIDKILEFSAKKRESVGFYGHLMMVAKYINECPAASPYLLEKETWTKLMEDSVREFVNRSLCPPGAELLAAKQRQIAKAGGSFLG